MAHQRTTRHCWRGRDKKETRAKCLPAANSVRVTLYVFVFVFFFSFCKFQYMLSTVQRLGRFCMHIPIFTVCWHFAYTISANIFNGQMGCPHLQWHSISDGRAAAAVCNKSCRIDESDCQQLAATVSQSVSTTNRSGSFRQNQLSNHFGSTVSKALCEWWWCYSVAYWCIAYHKSIQHNANNRRWVFVFLYSYLSRLWSWFDRFVHDAMWCERLCVCVCVRLLVRTSTKAAKENMPCK